MTRKKAMLTEFLKKGNPTTSFRDNNKGETLGYESIIWGNVIIENVVLVEDLKHIFLSISQLSDKGYQSTIYNKVCIVTNIVTGDIVLICQRHGNFYEASLRDWEKESNKYLYSKAFNKEI